MMTKGSIINSLFEKLLLYIEIVKPKSGSNSPGEVLLETSKIFILHPPPHISDVSPGQGISHSDKGLSFAKGGSSFPHQHS